MLQSFTGSEGNTLIGITPQPPTSWIVYLAILPDEPGRQQTTPYTFISTDLCNITPFLRLITTAQATCHGYLKDIHERNVVHLGFKIKYFIVPVYRANINDQFLAGLDTYITKVIYVNLPPDQTLHDHLAKLHVPAIIIYPNNDHAKKAKELGLDALGLKEITPSILNNKIENRFRLTPAELQQLGYKGDNTPNNTITKRPGFYEFTESGLTPHPTTPHRLLLPNERLSNHLRKRYPPSPLAIPNEERLPRLIETAETIATQKLVDFWIAGPNVTPAEIPADLRDLVSTYNNQRTANAYDALLSATRGQIREFNGPHDPILCVPALTKKNVDDHLKTIVPAIVRKYLYKAKGADYLTTIEQGINTHPEHATQLAAVLSIQALENEYLSCLLTLYALTSQRPVLRIPQFPSSLFTALATTRRTAPEKNRESFCNGIDNVCDTLNKQLPEAVREYLETIRTDHIKIISDLPMEWMSINDVPLVYQQDVSRIPITPGNVLFTHYANVGSTLRVDATAKILIINAMRSTDELYKHPETLVEFAKRYKLNVAYAEPANVKEYWSTITDEAPLILIHWGHGSYVRSDDIGYLNIRDEKTPVWNTTGVGVPPIVILGACETAALAETHNTPAMAWLALGARTVLATYFPVDAGATKVILARLIGNFADAVVKDTPTRTWSQVVSRTLGLNRYLDFLYGFERWRNKYSKKGAPEDFALEYTYRYNKAARPPREGYLACEDLMEETMAHFGKEYQDAFRHYRKHVKTIPHTMFFTQFGSPESIAIIKTLDADVQNNRAYEYWQERAAQETAPPATS